MNDGGVARKGADGKFVMRVLGSATNTLFYRNTIILSEDRRDTKIILHKRWGTLPESTIYQENHIVNLASNSSIELGKSSGNQFTDNEFFGNPLEIPAGED